MEQRRYRFSVTALRGRAGRGFFFALLVVLALTGVFPSPAGPGRAVDPVDPGSSAFVTPLLEAVAEDTGSLPACQRLFLQLYRGLAFRRDPSLSQTLIRVKNFFDARLEENPDSPLLLYGRGCAAKLAGRYAAAVRDFEAGIRAGARFWEIFGELIPYYRTKGEMQAAAGLLEECLARDPDNPFLFQGLGFIHFWRDEYGPSQRYYDRAGELLEASGDPADLAVCRRKISYLQMYLNRYDRARVEIERSLRLARKAESTADEIEGLELLAFVKIEQGDTRGGLDLVLEALDKAEALDDPRLEALCLRTLGVARMESGDLAAAEDCLSRAAAWYTRTGEERLLGVAMYWQARLYKQLGDFSRAMDLARRGLAASQREGFRTGEAFHLSAIGDFYHSLGHSEKALSYNKRALLISQNYIGKWSREECLNSIGAVYMESARYREALEYFKLALNYIRQIAHNREEARCLYNIGLAYRELEDEDRALDYFRRSRAEAERSGKRALLGLTLIRLGDLELRGNNPGAAENFYRRAMEIGSETGQPAVLWQACAGLGDLEARRDRILEAVEFYERAVAVIEDQRNHIMEREHSAGFFQSKLGVYESLINLYYGLHVIHPGRGYDRECFHYAEKVRSRVFLDDLQAASIDPRTFPASPETSRRIGTLSQEVSRILTELSRSDPDRERRVALWEELERAEEELQVMVEAAHRIRPDLALLLRCEPSRLEKIREAALDPGTGLIEFLVGEKNLFIFYLTRDRLAVHRLGAAETGSVRELARNYACLLSSPGMTAGDCATAGRRLYERLFLPGKDVITDEIRRLIVVPDRELCFLPFETLTPGPDPASGEAAPIYLMNTRSVTYVPSASSLVHILARAHDPGRPKDLMAVGDPLYPGRPEGDGQDDWDNLLQEYYLEKRFEVEPLPFTRREIEAVIRFVPRGRRDVLLGREATEEAFKNLPLSDYRILHFATHSLFDDRVANRSALVLSLDSDPGEDGFLQVHEIYRSRLDADLVVLSACRTGLGKLEKGEGVQGLPRAFFCAGAGSVLVSLWPVGDRPTSRFMQRFYDHLSRGESKSEALRNTKLDILRIRDSQPREWAGFILMGEGRRPIPLRRPSIWQRIKSRIFGTS